MRVEGLAICPERAYLASTCRPRPLIWMRFTIETGGPDLVLDVNRTTFAGGIDVRRQSQWPSVACIS
jgi:hypothetical protein